MLKCIKNENNELLMRALLELKTVEECYSFFEDLCTISELKSMAQRIEVAKMLNDKCIYTDIAAKTGASTATISRVNKCLNYGSDGYAMVLKRLKEKENE
ncbi:MAG: YerC/YecD family TrpR-related protein [Firmicutes bacterium]|nr:YerC/YecD family TrpR-related protein [Bacillota bacterium]